MKGDSANKLDKLKENIVFGQGLREALKGDKLYGLEIIWDAKEFKVE